MTSLIRDIVFMMSHEALYHSLKSKLKYSFLKHLTFVTILILVP